MYIMIINIYSLLYNERLAAAPMCPHSYQLQVYSDSPVSPEHISSVIFESLEWFTKE